MSEKNEKQTLIIVDDDPEILELLEIYAKREGYRTIPVTNGAQAVDKVKTHPEASLMILDMMLPELDGTEVIRKIRKDSNIPILVVSARSADSDKIKGLIIGADDYVSKPFNPLEVMARVKSLIRRAKNQITDDHPDVVDIGSLIINYDSHTVKTPEGKSISLTAMEFEILYLLATNLNRVFSADEIFKRVWKEDTVLSPKTVMVHVSHLRDKIEAQTGENKIIETVWGVGYKISG
ncbi:response regulator transcription factor [Xylocopilactobacillus apicola]|uniref:DNA-binding response regulator n=1 Tax=Xylocopilactobacillus apicola TaxID=2932184 RepID=A0AAU9DW62_9LACO|nr:response regulator transcription factor [Xylocopilactobacillus apicola]BDR59738.1 DNA-binding response regulator [Xylocopilactobacillus apicola]